MNKLRKLVVVGLLGATVMVASAPAAAKVTVVFLSAGDPSQWEGDPSQWIQGDPSQWRPSLNYAKIEWDKVNEYEGQHRFAGEGEEEETTDLLTRKVNEYEGQHR